MLIIIYLWRRSQVAKATVCKTVIPRFKSGRRLQNFNGIAGHQVAILFARDILDR